MCLAMFKRLSGLEAHTWFGVCRLKACVALCSTVMHRAQTRIPSPHSKSRDISESLYALPFFAGSVQPLHHHLPINELRDPPLPVFPPHALQPDRFQALVRQISWFKVRAQQQLAGTDHPNQSPSPLGVGGSASRGMPCTAHA